MDGCIGARRVCSCWDHAYDDCAAAVAAHRGMQLDALEARIEELTDKLAAAQAAPPAVAESVERVARDLFGILAACQGCSDGEEYPCSACKRVIISALREPNAAPPASPGAGYLHRNTRWAADKPLEGEWTCVPTEDFDRAYAALNTASPGAEVVVCHFHDRPWIPLNGHRFHIVKTNRRNFLCLCEVEHSSTALQPPRRTG